MTTQEDIVVYAIRYCLGRLSYAAYDGIEIAKRYGAEMDRIRPIIIKDIEEGLYSYNMLADHKIRDGWIEVLVFLRQIENTVKE